MCNIPVELDNLQTDPIYDNLLVYVDKLKTSLLRHTLTPLEESLYPSLKLQQQANQIQSANSSMSNINDNDKALSQPDCKSKRSHDITDENEEDELENEYYDSTPASKKPRTATDSQKRRLFDPRNMLGDMLPPSMSLSSQLSTLPRPNTQNLLGNPASESDQHQQPTENLSLLSAVASAVGSTSTETITQDTKDTTPSRLEDLTDLDSVASDIDHDDDVQVNNFVFFVLVSFC